MNEPTSKRAICFGEILWDSLPRGLFPGGAPMNVAYHLKQLGVQPIPISSVGRDQLGEELLRRLKAWNVDTSGIGLHPTKPTGLARVTLVDGSPRFEIVEDVAWDAIELSADALGRALQCDAIVFGSLAQRTENNRRQLATLLELNPKALKVFDVNLRPPYDSAEQVWALAQRADFIKLNDQELSRLMNGHVTPADTAGSGEPFRQTRRGGQGLSYRRRNRRRDATRWALVLGIGRSRIRSRHGGRRGRISCGAAIRPAGCQTPARRNPPPRLAPRRVRRDTGWRNASLSRGCRGKRDGMNCVAGISTNRAVQRFPLRVEEMHLSQIKGEVDRLTWHGSIA